MTNQFSVSSPLAIPEDEQRQIVEMYQEMQKGQAKLVGPDGVSHELPQPLHSFLVQLIRDLYEGKSVAVLRSDAQLTTGEAARLLGVSRQFFVGELEKGKLPFHLVGTHRRIYMRDVMQYREKRDERRKAILNELTIAEAAEGLYDREPCDGRAE